MNLQDLRLIDTSCKPLPGTIVPCLMCCKPFLMRKYIGVPDQVCPECFDTYKDCATVVCVNCRVVIARVHPGIIDNGYYIRPNSVLHVDQCNTCANFANEAELVSTVIEIDAYQRKTGIRPSIIVPAGYKSKGNNE